MSGRAAGGIFYSFSSLLFFISAKLRLLSVFFGRGVWDWLGLLATDGVIVVAWDCVVFVKISPWR